MSYFFSGVAFSGNNEIILSGPEARHILLSRRIKPGEQIKLQDPSGQRVLAEVTAVGKQELRVRPASGLSVPAEPKVVLTLFLSMVSEKALDFILQKGTELGLGAIVLFNSANTATALSEQGFNKKKDRWEKIMAEAAKQSDRGFWPSLEFKKDLTSAIASFGKFDKIILLDINGKKGNFCLTWPQVYSCALVVGPEGGFLAEEIGAMTKCSNVDVMGLGPILLRAETAALAGLSVLRLIAY